MLRIDFFDKIDDCCCINIPVGYTWLLENIYIRHSDWVST